MRADPTTFSPVAPSPTRTAPPSGAWPAGIRLQCPTTGALDACTQAFLGQLEALELRQCVDLSEVSASTGGGFEQGFQLRADLSRIWAPEHDTTSLHLYVEQSPAHADHELEREIVLAMLLSPLAFGFPGHAELAAAVRMQSNIVVAARKTALACGTSDAGRPEDCWTYASGKGFVVKAGCALIPALIKATCCRAQRTSPCLQTNTLLIS